MATIAKVSNGASASSALGYGLGEGKPMHNDTEKWLDEHELTRSSDFEGARAVFAGGTNGIDPLIAKTQFRAVRLAFNQTQRRNQVLRISQSFSEKELSSLKKADWQKANDLGIELAEKLYPEYQSAVYTHLDGKNHILHNHIIVNKVNLLTGKKMDEKKGQLVNRLRKANDEIAKSQGWQVIKPVLEHKSQTEIDLVEKNQYSYMHDLRDRIDSVMADTSVRSYKTFSECLEQKGVKVQERGKNISYAFLDANNKQRRARGTRLGKNYEKEVLDRVLAKRTREQQRIDEINREVEQRESDTQQRKSRVTTTTSKVESLTVATSRTQGDQSQNIEQTNKIIDKQNRFRKAINSFRTELQRFENSISNIAGQVKQFVTDQQMRLNFLEKMKTDISKKEKQQRDYVARDLTKKKPEKPIEKQPQERYNGYRVRKERGIER